MARFASSSRSGYVGGRGFSLCSFVGPGAACVQQAGARQARENGHRSHFPPPKHMERRLKIGGSKHCRSNKIRTAALASCILPQRAVSPTTTTTITTHFWWLFLTSHPA